MSDKPVEESEPTLNDVGTILGKMFYDLDVRITKLEDDKNNSVKNLFKNLKLAVLSRK
jgi:hypothetical protein